VRRARSATAQTPPLGAGMAMVCSLLPAAVIWNLGTWLFGLPAAASSACGVRRAAISSDELHHWTTPAAGACGAS